MLLRTVLLRIVPISNPLPSRSFPCADPSARSRRVPPRRPASLRQRPTPSQSRPSRPGCGSEPVAESYDQQFARARGLATSGQRDEAIALYIVDARAFAGQLRRAARPRPYLCVDGAAGRKPKPTCWRRPRGRRLCRCLVRARATCTCGAIVPQQAAEAYGQWQALSPTSRGLHRARSRLSRCRRLGGGQAQIRSGGRARRRYQGVDDYKASLQQRMRKPDAVLPEGYRGRLRMAQAPPISIRIASDWNDYEACRCDASSIAARSRWKCCARDRFESHDNAWALDAYVHSVDRAYANVRYQDGPTATCSPTRSGACELFQGVGNGWELSGSYDHLEFDGRHRHVRRRHRPLHRRLLPRYRALYVPAAVRRQPEPPWPGALLLRGQRRRLRRTRRRHRAATTR